MRTAQGENLRYQEIVSVKPACLPIHLNELKRHVNLGLDVAAQDQNLTRYLSEAVQAVEQDSGRALVMQTRKLYLEQWPVEVVELRGCPVVKVDSAVYVDGAGDSTTWDDDDYQVNLADEPARLRPAWNGFWPTARQQEQSICVTFKCGYIIPFTANATTNVLTLQGYTPTNGETWRVSTSEGTLPEGLSANTDYYVVNASGSTCKLSATSGGSAIDITSAGAGMLFLGELDPKAAMALYLKVAMRFEDREGAAYKQCLDGYWGQIYGLRYEGV